MSAFEKELLYKLLVMFEQYLRKNGVIFMGNDCPADLVNDYIDKVHEVRETLGYFK